MSPPAEAEAWPDIDPSLISSPFPAPPTPWHPSRPYPEFKVPLGTVSASAEMNAGASYQQDTSRLVPYISITPTIKEPSDIALAALDQLNPADPEYQLCFEYFKYLDQCEQKKFLIKGYNTKKGEFINLPMEYTNRWCPTRRNELSGKLNRLTHWFELQEDRPVTMITLTSKRRDISIADSWRDLNYSKEKLQKLIHKYYGDVDYFWVPEPHKDGYVHYHMAVFADVDNNTKDKRGEGIEDKLRNLCRGSTAPVPIPTVLISATKKATEK